MFQLMDSTGINFVNRVEDQELENSFLFRNFYNGGGVGIGDINNDGLADVILTSNMGENKLYLNKGNWKFEDITAASKMKQDSMWSTGVVMADINNDGWLDIYICNSGHMQSGHRRNKLYINNHDLSFTESAAKFGLDISSYATQVSFFDYDLDGDLDCFMISNSPMPVNTLGYTNRRDLPASEWPVEKFIRDGGDHLYRNNNGKFTEVTKEAGIHGTLISFGLGASVGDVNNDGYPDIYVSNDSYERDYLYINQRNGRFKDETENCMQQMSFSSMGADLADINNDGYADLFTTDMLPEGDYRLKTLGAFDNVDLYNNKVKLGFYHQYMKNCLQLNNGDGTFSEISNYSGVDATDWSWGALIFDADNDGLNDLYICNGVNKDVTNLDFMSFFADDVIKRMVLTGKKDNVDEVLKHIPVTPMANKTFRNKGNLRFEDVGAAWGLDQGTFSNGAAYGDLDNDGDLDLVVNNENQPSIIYQNRASQISGNHYISLQLRGDSMNRFAIGSKVRIYNESKMYYRELIPSRGFQSSVDYRLILGLGNAKKIDSLVITWPDLTQSIHLNLKTDSNYLMLKRGSETLHAAPSVNRQLFDSLPSSFEKHEENDYVDFYYERNIPAMLSKEGPRASVADVNGDKLDDIYIGGTKGYPGRLYTQNAFGKFNISDQKVFFQFANFEDGAALFFDADNDGDQDLFVGPAGNEQPAYSREMQCRLLLNDGNGNFSLSAKAFPQTGINTNVVVPFDFDRDNDIDLFIGARSEPKDYGADAQSFLMVNDGHGNFADRSKSLLPKGGKIGMITAATWDPLLGNNQMQLIIAGEWMAPMILQFDKERFREVTTNLSAMNGWWQSVAVADMDNDGRKDIILGNTGENFYLHPSEAAPVKLWRYDFDGSGDIDKILTRYVDGQDKPVFLKNDIQDQVPGIKKQNLKNHEYALRSVQQLFSEEAMSKAEMKLFNYPSSVIAFNNGNGQFEISKLPPRAQLSSVNAIKILDINNDGRPDIVSAGNRSGFLPQLQKLDASYGDVFINRGNRNFEWQDSKISNIKVTGEVRDIATIHKGDETCVLFLRNNDFPKMYRLNKQQ